MNSILEAYTEKLIDRTQHHLVGFHSDMAVNVAGIYLW